jgi:hypothetical protein
MEVEVFVNTHVEFGGVPPFSYMGYFLAKDAPDFGQAVALLKLEPYFSSRRTDIPEPFSSHSGEYHDLLMKLPTTKFERDKKRLNIRYWSRCCSYEDFETKKIDPADGKEYRIEPWVAQPPKALVIAPPRYDVDLFVAFYEELRSSVLPQFLVKCIKKTDDFDVVRYLSWIESRENLLPRTPEALKHLSEQMFDFDNETKKDVDEWDALDIDWGEYHDEAKSILNDPFFWDCVNEFSPHGNDTGADVFELFREWHAKGAPGESRDFFDQTMNRWGLDPELQDPFSWEVHRDGVIGLAFAYLKFEGACPAWTRLAALEVMSEERARMRQGLAAWVETDERLQTYALIEKVLLRAKTAEKAGKSSK